MRDRTNADLRREPDLSLPRPSIAHFLLWIFGSAMVLALQRLAGPKNVVMPLAIVESIVEGAGVAAIVLLIHHRWHGIMLPSMPGHWLILAQGVNAVALRLCYSLFYFVREQTDIVWFESVVGLYRLSSAGVFAMYLFLMCRAYVGAKRLTEWRVAFSTYVAVSGLRMTCFFMESMMWMFSFGNTHVISSFQMELSLFGPIILGCVVIAVVATDLASRVRRDWLHWTGVAVEIGCQSVKTAWWSGWVTLWQS